MARSAQKILLAEPDEGERQLLSGSLEEKGYSVTTARTWHEALGRIESERPALAIVDAADESFAAVCADPALKGVPVVALSSDYCDEAIATEAGCTLCLEKPVRPETLAWRVARLLAQRSAPGLA